jgi:multidrug resistance protein
MFRGIIAAALRQHGEPEGARKARNMRKLLALVCLVIFVDSLGYGVVVPVMPVYADELGVTQAGLGLLFAAYALGNIVAAVPFGMLSDKVGRRPFLVFGMFAMAGAFVLYAYSTTFIGLFLSRFLDGVTAAANWSVGLAIIPDIYPEGERGQAMGTVMAAMGAGAIAGPAIGGILYDTLGLQAPFLLVSLICVVGGVAALISKDLRELPPPSGEGSYWRMAKTVLGYPGMMLILLIVMMGSVALGVLEPLFPIHLQDTFGLGSTAIGLLFALTVLAYTLASPPVGKYADLRGKKKPIVVGLVTTAIVAPALTFAGNLAMVILLFTVIGVTIALFETPTLPYIADLISGREGGEVYGTAFGLFNVSWALGYLVGPAAGGFLAQKHGLPTAMIIMSIPLVILAWKAWEKL